jgi:hypothetical protein
VTRPKRFRDMSLTEEEAGRLAAIAWHRMTVRRWAEFQTATEAQRDRFIGRAQSMLARWRRWGIERERLWFAMIGLGLDIEGDERDMPRAEMRLRIERFAVASRVTLGAGPTNAWGPRDTMRMVTAERVLWELDRRE